MPDDNAAARAAEYDTRIARWADRLAAAPLTPAQQQGYACVACGHNPFDRAPGESPRSMYVAGYGKLGVSSHVFVCIPCDEQFIRELAAQIAPAGVRVAVDLHDIAGELEFLGHVPHLVERLRRDIRVLGYRADDVDDPDMVAAAATMLTAYAPGVNDDARDLGERVLRLVGGESA